MKVLELLRDASALSRATTGVSLPTNLSVALCVSDCVTSAGEHARWTQDEPSSSGIGDDNSRSSSSSSSGSSSFDGSNIVSSDESSDTNSGRQNTAAKPSLPWRYRLPQTEALPDPINHHQEPPRPVGPVFALTACAGSTHVPFPVFMNRSTPADNLEGFDFFKVHFQALARSLARSEFVKSSFFPSIVVPGYTTCVLIPPFILSWSEQILWQDNNR